MGSVAIILSDLHLGSLDSIVNPTSCPAGKTYEQYIQELVLNPLKKNIEGYNRKYLILNGDTFDFSLQAYTQVFEAAGRFFNIIARSQMFSQIILNIGNHDHNLWQLLQHQVKVVKPIEEGKLPSLYPHAQIGVLDLASPTDDFSGELHLPTVSLPYGEMFLKGLFKIGNIGSSQITELPKVPIAVVYPNLYLITKKHLKNDNPILITHGHFFCLPWIVLTEVFPKTLGVNNDMTLQQLEEINSPLTELGWTALGQAGVLTQAVRKVYVDVFKEKSTQSAGQVIDELKDYLKNFIWKNLLACGAKEKISNFVEETRAHKGDSKFTDEESNRQLIGKYLNISFSPLHNPDFSLLNKDGGAQVTLIFGHTHVPIEPKDKLGVPIKYHDRSFSVNAMNTGGFMDDKTPGVGALAIIIDSNGSITSRELWRSS